jgi:heme-degrading monooxygenase HmoA
MPLIRIVKMNFKENEIETFKKIFDERKLLIAGFPGCHKVELLQDKNIFFTYSIWDNEASLEEYRDSDLFNSTWALVKPLFAEKAEAWSMDRLW